VFLDGRRDKIVTEMLMQTQIPVNRNALKLMTEIWARQKIRGIRNGSIPHINPVT